MVFKSQKDFEKFVLSKCKVAVKEAEDKMHFIINKFLEQYYNEFTPEEYIRTHQLLHSLVKADVKSTGNGFEADIYFDASALKYDNPVRGKSGMMHDAIYSEGEVLDMAMHGSHGGWVDGTAIWDRSLAILDAQAIDILKHSLIANGIPIK